MTWRSHCEKTRFFARERKINNRWMVHKCTGENSYFLLLAGEMMGGFTIFSRLKKNRTALACCCCCMRIVNIQRSGAHFAKKIKSFFFFSFSREIESVLCREGKNESFFRGLFCASFFLIEKTFCSICSRRVFVPLLDPFRAYLFPLLFPPQIDGMPMSRIPNNRSFALLFHIVQKCSCLLEKLIFFLCHIFFFDFCLMMSRL